MRAGETMSRIGGRRNNQTGGRMRNNHNLDATMTMDADNYNSVAMFDKPKTKERTVAYVI